MRRRAGLFLVRSIAVWCVMVVILVVVPDTLERWMPLHVARVFGWVLASGIWVAILERDWQERFAPLLRFTLQIAIWLSAAFAAIWISDQFRVRWFD